MLGLGPLGSAPRGGFIAPIVLEVSPAEGAQLGGTSVTVKGLNLESGSAVTFNGAALVGSTYVDRHSFTGTTPAAVSPWLDDVQVVGATNGAILRHTKHSAFDRLQVGSVIAVNPASLPNSGLYLDYPGGGAWPSTLGQTDSFPIYLDQSIAFDAFPTAGTAVNGYTPLVTDGATQALDSANVLSPTVYGGDPSDNMVQPRGDGAAGFTAMALVWFPSAAAPSAAPETDPGLWADSSGYPCLGLTFSTNGVAGVAYDGIRRSSVKACSTGAWHWVVMRCSATAMSVRVDGSESTPTTIDLNTISDIMGIGQPVAIGKNPYVAYQAARVLAFGFVGRKLSDAEADGAGTFVQTRFGLSLGFVATAADPSTFSRSTFWWASYAGGVRWAGTRRMNNANGNALGNASFTAPGTSTLNGQPTATFNGTTDALVATRRTTDMLGTDEGGRPITYQRDPGGLGYSLSYVAKFNTLPVSGGVAYVGACLFTDPQAVVGLSVSSDTGVQAYQIDDLYGQNNYVTTPGVLLGTGAWGLIQSRWTGTDRLEARLCAGGVVGAWQPVVCRPYTYPTAAGRPWFGANYSNLVWLDGEIAAAQVSQRVFTTYTLDGVGFYLQQKYAQNFGYAIGGSCAVALKSYALTAAGTQSLSFTGTAAIALSRLALAAAGAETFTGTCAIAVQRYAVTGAGGETFTGTCALTLKSYTCSGAGALQFVGTCAATMQSYAIAALGSETFTGTCAIARSTFTLAAAGAETFTGSAAIAVQPYTASGAGAETFTGTCAIALSPYACSGAGTYTALAITGTCALALQSYTAAAAGLESFVGTCAIARSTFTLAGTGTYTPQPITGTGAVALSRFAPAGAGSLVFTGSAAMTLASLALAAVGSSGTIIQGTAAIALQPYALAGAGSYTPQAISGTGAVALQPLALVGAGAEIFAGVGAIVLRSLTVNAAGELRFQGGAALALSSLALAAAAEERFAGSAALALASYTTAAIASERFEGLGAFALSPYTLAAAGAERFEGAAAIAIARLALAAAGTYTPQPISGSGAIALQPYTLAGVGPAFGVTGTGAIALSRYAVAGAGGETFVGAGALTLRSLSTSGAGLEAFTGAGSIAMARYAVAAIGTRTIFVTGSGAIALAPLGVDGAGAQRFEGVIALTLEAYGIGAAAEQSFEGEAAIELAALALAGAGDYSQLTIEGTGEIAYPGFGVDGAGDQTFIGTGALSLASFHVHAAGWRLNSTAPAVPAQARILTRVSAMVAPVHVVGTVKVFTLGRGIVKPSR